MMRRRFVPSLLPARAARLRPGPRARVSLTADIARSDATKQSSFLCAAKLDCFASVQPGDMTDGCSETWLTRQNWQDSSNKGASHAVARGVCHGPATRVRNACQAGWSKPAEAVPAVQHQCPDRIQVD